MVFNSFEFLIFFGLVYAAYLFISFRAQNFLLLAASYFFYGYWDWRFLGLILLSTTLDYFCALKIDQAPSQKIRKLWLWLTVGSNLGILGFFKYYNFFMANLSGMLLGLGLPAPSLALQIILPVGISFYTFQTMSYTIDVYRGTLKPVRSWFDFALYVAYFPQLVAGPIERATHLLPQLTSPRRITSSQIYQGCWLTLWGFYQKVFIADNLATIVQTVFSLEKPQAGGDVLVAVYIFALQIFCDFAGYSNIARGISKLLGIELMTNFGTPYFVTNPRDFWRNWHISLSTWLKDYLYIPLGGDRGTAWKTYRNLLLTMLLGGLWHGAAWTFVLWGLFHGVLLITHRALSPLLNRWSPLSFESALVIKIVSGLVMFHLTCFGWMIFRADSLAALSRLSTAIFSDLSLTPRGLDYLKQFFIHGWLLIVIQLGMIKGAGEIWIFKMPAILRALIYIVVWYSILWGGKFGGKEFIYFQF